MTEIWLDEDRHLPRAHYIIPCLLRDKETRVYLKAVMLDISADGCRVFTNDRRVRYMKAEQLMGKRFEVEFDFFDVDTGAITGEVVNVHPGKNADEERQLGLRFVSIPQDSARDINRIVSRHAASGP